MKQLLLLLNVLILTNIKYPQTGWYLQNSGAGGSFNTVYFINDQTGFVSGGITIFKTTNGGISWTGKILPDTSMIYSIRFENQLTGYACGGRGVNNYVSYQYLFKTTNGGDNWTKIFNTTGSMTSEYFYDVYSQNNFICLADGGFGSMATVGSVICSTNGGVSYPYYLNMYDESFDKLSFINSQTGWVSARKETDTQVGERRIYKTTNSGANWTLQFHDASQYMGYSSLMNVRFINSNTGFTLYRAREKAKFAKTTNGGLNWDTVSFTHQNSQAMFFVNANTGWIGGTSSTDSELIRRTTNSGQSWQTQKIGNGQINSIFFINDMTGWAVGLNNLILKTVTGGVTDIKVVSDELPASYSLSQNYPNPFNPVTRIRYDLPRAGVVRLAVYDIMGREVETIVNERQAAGSYEAVWDGTRFASGVYFYRLTAEGYGETRKMLLIR